MHKLTLKKLVRPSSYGTRISSADVYIDDIMIGSAYNYGSPDEITFYPNTHGDAYLANFISISKLFELIIKAATADKAVDAEIAEIAEIAETKAIFINAKDNTMSYIPPDADENIRKKLIFYGYEFIIGITSVDGETDCFADTRNNLEAEVDKNGPDEGSNFGFFFINIGFGGYDFEEIFWGFRSDSRSWLRSIGRWSGEPDGSYRDMIIYSKKYSYHSTFIGNAIINTNKYTIEQLSNEVKCFHIEDKGSGPVIVEHKSNPRITTLDNFII
jgi:hypothetical protein